MRENFGGGGPVRREGDVDWYQTAMKAIGFLAILKKLQRKLFNNFAQKFSIPSDYTRTVSTYDKSYSNIPYI